MKDGLRRDGVLLAVALGLGALAWWMAPAHGLRWSSSAQETSASISLAMPAELGSLPPESSIQARGWWHQARAGSVFFAVEGQNIDRVELEVAGKRPRLGGRAGQEGLLGCMDLPRGRLPLRLNARIRGAGAQLRLGSADELPGELAPVRASRVSHGPLWRHFGSMALRVVALLGATIVLAPRLPRRVRATLLGGALAWMALEATVRMDALPLRTRIPGSTWIDYDFGPQKSVKYMGVHPTNVQEFETLVRWNEHGFRDDPWDAQAPHWIVLGDSFVAGHEVPLPDTFHQLLEAQTPGVEVRPLARGGTGPVEQLGFLESASREATRGVLWCFFPGNDVMDSSPPLAAHRRRWVEDVYYAKVLPARVELLRASAGPSRALAWVVDRGLPWIEPLWLRWHAGLSEEDMRSPAGDVFTPQEDQLELWNAAWAQVRETFERGAELCRREDLPLVVVILPTDHWPLPGTRSSSEGRSYPTQRTLELCPELAIDCIDLQAALVDDAQLYYPHDGHWTPDGHLRVAQALANELTRLGWLPPQ